MMRVLALTNLYPNPLAPHRAPFNRHQFRLLGQRVALRVVSPVAWTDELRRGGLSGLGMGRRRTRELDGLTVTYPRHFFVPRLGRRWYGHFFQWSIARTVRRVVTDFQPDVIFAPWAYPDGWAAVRLGRSLGLPVVLQVHGSDIKLLDAVPARRAPTREAVAAADAVVAVSEDLRREVIALGADKAKVTVIYDGVDPEVFHPGDRRRARGERGFNDNERVVLFVGNLVPVKAIDVLLRAVALVAKDLHNVRVVIIGEGPERGRLRALSVSLGISGQVDFRGAIAQPLLADWYRSADVFVLPSHSEGVPNVLLEASACGTPWIATSVGGIPEIADLGASRLVPPNDPVTLAAALAASLQASAEQPRTPPSVRTRDEAVTQLEHVLRGVVRTEGGEAPHALDLG